MNAQTHIDNLPITQLYDEAIGKWYYLGGEVKQIMSIKRAGDGAYITNYLVVYNSGVSVEVNGRFATGIWRSHEHQDDGLPF